MRARRARGPCRGHRPRCRRMRRHPAPPSPPGPPARAAGRHARRETEGRRHRTSSPSTSRSAWAVLPSRGTLSRWTAASSRLRSRADRLEDHGRRSVQGLRGQVPCLPGLGGEAPRARVSEGCPSFHRDAPLSLTATSSASPTAGAGSQRARRPSAERSGPRRSPRPAPRTSRRSAPHSMREALSSLGRAQSSSGRTSGLSSIAAPARSTGQRVPTRPTVPRPRPAPGARHPTRDPAATGASAPRRRGPWPRRRRPDAGPRRPPKARSERTQGRRGRDTPRGPPLCQDGSSGDGADAAASSRVCQRSAWVSASSSREASCASG